MGPGQFIPSTWLLYTDRISDLTGNRPANPWNPIDAFMGTALLSKDNGADKGTRAAERLAALRYLAGWKNATKPAYAFYGDQVMNYAADFDAKITILKNSGGAN
jgi:membrane-bound lytic murein transglycosylase B